MLRWSLLEQYRGATACTPVGDHSSFKLAGAYGVEGGIYKKLIVSEELQTGSYWSCGKKMILSPIHVRSLHGGTPGVPSQGFREVSFLLRFFCSGGVEAAVSGFSHIHNW